MRKPDQDLFLYPKQYCPHCCAYTPRGRMGDCAECGVIARAPNDPELPPLRLPPLISGSPTALQLAVNFVVVLVVGGVAGAGAWIATLVAMSLIGAGAGTAHNVGVAVGIIVGFVVFVGVGMLVALASDDNPSNNWNDE